MIVEVVSVLIIPIISPPFFTIENETFLERVPVKKASSNISQRCIRDRGAGDDAAGSDATPAHDAAALGIAATAFAPQSHVYPRQPDSSEPLSAVYGFVRALLSVPNQS